MDRRSTAEVCRSAKTPESIDASQYGDYIIRLKSDVKKRATYTGADSLAMDFTLRKPRLQPSPVRRPSVASLFSEYELLSKHGTRELVGRIRESGSAIAHPDGAYPETQIFGQVRRKDIAEIIVRPGGAVTPRMRQLAAESNIPIRKLACEYE